LSSSKPVSKDIEKINRLGIEDDGDFETQQRLFLAYDTYMKGSTVQEAADKSGLREWQVLSYACKGHKGRLSWAEQRKQARLDFIKDCNDLTKMSLSRAYKGTTDTLHRTLEHLNKAMDDGKLEGQDIIKASNMLIKGLQVLNEIFTPTVKNPLVNINMPNKPSENEMADKLSDWGLIKDNAE
jgi:hypothetical protein